MTPAGQENAAIPTTQPVQASMPRRSEQPEPIVAATTELISAEASPPDLLDPGRAADDLRRVRAAQAEGFTGAAWAELSTSLAHYAYGVIGAWIGEGTVFAHCRRKQIKVSRGRRFRPDDAEDLLAETVATSVVLFRDVLAAGQWDPAKGASLSTYFIGHCLMQFSPIYRSWLRGARRDARLRAALAAPSVPAYAPDPAVVFERGVGYAELLAQIDDALTREIVVLKSRGWTQPQIVAELGVTDGVIEGRLFRLRRKLMSTPERRALQPPAATPRVGAAVLAAATRKPERTQRGGPTPPALVAVSRPEPAVGFAGGRQLEEWLAQELENNVANTLRRVEDWAYPNGMCLSPAGRAALAAEVASAVGEASAEVLAAGSFEGAAPVQVRVYISKRAAGKVMAILRQQWRQLALEVDAADEAPVDAGEPTRWLSGLARGRPAEPLLYGLSEFARGAEVAEITTGLRRFGLDLCDDEVAIELLKALWFARRTDRSLSGLLGDARPRLGRYVERYFFSRGLVDTRLLVVVVDQAFGVPARLSGEAFAISAPRVRNLRRQARSQCPIVGECFEDTTSLGWGLAAPTG